MSAHSDSERPNEQGTPGFHPAAYREPEPAPSTVDNAPLSEALPDWQQQAEAQMAETHQLYPQQHDAQALYPQQHEMQAAYPQQPDAQTVYAQHTTAQPTYQQPTYAPPVYAPFQAESVTASHEAGEGVMPVLTPAAAPRSAQPQSRGGALIAGIAIGALLGGAIGGGTAAVVASNMAQPEQQSVASPASNITLNSAEEVGIVSAVAAVATPSVVTLSVTGARNAGSGSGVIYSEDGYIVTNAHVATLDGEVGSEANIRVRLSDGRVLDATLVGVDPFSDLAVVKVEADDLTPVKIGDSDDLHVGDTTVVIGAPLNLANTVTSGVVSALYRGISVGTTQLPDGSEDSDEDRGDDEEGSPWGFRFGEGDDDSTAAQRTAAVTLPVIQTDASINPGNSGGALLNSRAELIGINVAIASNRTTEGTAGSDGLGFAIPVNLAVRVVDAIIAGEQPSHGLLGAGVDDSVRASGPDANRIGALIVDLTPGGAAEAAGLRVGDVVTAIEGIPVDSGTSLSALVRMQQGGSTVTLDFTRGGVLDELEVTLGTLEW